MKPESKNKRCPFCGGEAEVKEVGTCSAVVRCKVCGCATAPTQAADVETAKRLAMDTWERRVK